LNLKFSDLEKALNEALESAQSLGKSANESIGKLSAEELADIPTELSQDIAKRIRDAAEMGDVTTLNAIAAEIKTQSESCVPLSKQIVQLAEDFDLDDPKIIECIRCLLSKLIFRFPNAMCKTAE
jgi:hypothetical protein